MPPDSPSGQVEGAPCSVGMRLCPWRSLPSLPARALQGGFCEGSLWVGPTCVPLGTGSLTQHFTEHVWPTGTQSTTSLAQRCQRGTSRFSMKLERLRIRDFPTPEDVRDAGGPVLPGGGRGHWVSWAEKAGYTHSLCSWHTSANHGFSISAQG